MTGSVVDPVWKRLIELSRENDDLGYGEFVTQWPLDYYRKRLRQIQFEGYEDVLDVGCGFGQWLIALATLNRRVTGVDMHQKRVETCNALANDLWLDNVKAEIASATELPFPDESFDALFCYGVFMFVDRAQALAEFRRVLRPGGALYICTNARGWWLKLGLENLRKNRNLANVSFKAFLSGRHKGMPNATDLADVSPMLARSGFVDVRAAGEGRLTSDGASRSLMPHYPAKHLGYDCVIEFTSRKSAPQEDKSPLLPALRKTAGFELLDQYVERAVEAREYSYKAALTRYATMDTSEETFASKLSVIALARTVTAEMDRPTVLKRIFDITTQSTPDKGEQVRRCITLGQKLFYHHFAVQPMLDAQTLLSDPLEVIIFGACRCGSAARFLIDLMLTNGIEARMVAGACHTAAEAKIDGRWVLADASLYPPGVFPLGADGDLLTMDEAVLDPSLLDLPPSYINYETGAIAKFAADYPVMAGQIMHWLRWPILPSTAYFAADLGNPSYAAQIRHFEKNCGAKPPSDAQFGWSSVTEGPPTACPQLPVIQRPEQVQKATLCGDALSWLPPTTADDVSIVYDVHLSAQSRGWTYDAIPVGNMFTLVGEQITTDQCTLKVPDAFLGKAIYLSIVARRADNAAAFHLPSREFLLNA